MNTTASIGPIGAHNSAAGGAFNALTEAARIGGTTFQLFTANQRRWDAKPLKQEHIDKFRAQYAAGNFSHGMSHASYLINLASPIDASWKRSIASFREEIKRCQALGLTYLNFHPGAALTSTRQEGMDRIVAALKQCKDLFEKRQSPRLLFEMTAGQGSTLGVTFEEVGYMVAQTKEALPVGICIDTCHIFAAGYDIRTAAGWDRTLDLCEKHVGLKHLYAIHLNDSKHPCNSRKDRHAPLGKGMIGWDSFIYLVQSPRTRHLPKYLETPDGPELWKKEIAQLKEHAKGTLGKQQ